MIYTCRNHLDENNLMDCNDHALSIAVLYRAVFYISSFHQPDLQLNMAQNLQNTTNNYDSYNVNKVVTEYDYK